MNGIYYKEGIYVLIDNDTQNDIYVYHPHYEGDVPLYGGRIRIIRDDYDWKNAKLYIDGISIVILDSRIFLVDRLPLSIIVSHLNAIEINGVDSFLEHYKKSIELLYAEIKELNQKTESLLTSVQDDSKVKSLLSELAKIRDLLFSVLAILFSLYSFMTAGLENEKVINVCQSIMDSLS